MSFETLTNDEIKFRTDNPAENFHKNLNNFIDINKPKFSYFLEHFKKLIIIKYNQYINLLNENNNHQRDKFSIANDIIDFLKDLNLKKIDFINILQVDDSDNDIIYKIGNNILKTIFNSNFDDIDENKNKEEKDLIDSDLENEINNSIDAINDISEN